MLPKVFLAIRLSNRESSEIQIPPLRELQGRVCVCVGVKGSRCSFSSRLLKFPQRIKAVVSFLHK